MYEINRPDLDGVKQMKPFKIVNDRRIESLKVINVIPEEVKA